jgi:tripartite-type tricarboxylate transporter receptor subunit TctC
MKHVLAALTVSAATAAYGQAFPSKPIRLIVPFAPGGSSEFVARTVSAEMAKGLRQNFVIENKPGGGGNIAMQEVARANPDGYTLIIGHIGLRAIAIGPPERIAVLPEVPSVAEQGYPGFETSQWYGLIGPAKLPQPVVRRLADEAAKATRSRAVLERLEVESAIPVGSTPQEFAQFIAKSRCAGKKSS